MDFDWTIELSNRNQYGRIDIRIIDHLPRVGQRQIGRPQIQQASRISSADRLLRHAMAAEAHAFGHASNGQISGCKPEKQQVDFVAIGLYCLSENRPRRGGQAHFAPRAPQNEPVPAGFRIGS